MKLLPVSVLLPALVLQGCAAAVIPLAAGALMTQGERQGGTDAPVRTASTAGAGDFASAAPEADSDGTAGLMPETLDALRRAGIDPVAQAPVLTGLSALPQPGPKSGPEPAAPDAAFDAAYSAFADYALGIAARDPLQGEIRPSALLARAGTLVPDPAPCRFTGNAVLIDLDPADGVLDPAAPVSRPLLSEALAELRAAGIEVVWGTALTADRAGDVRGWLGRSGLDPAGEDRLLLLRYPEDRKQTRREEAATERCLVAILGDERSDFDELFDYLKQPDAAAGLDAMLGEGWFLAPVSQPARTDEGPQE